MNTITRWNTYSDLNRLQDRMLRAMRFDPSSENENEGNLLSRSDWMPPVDITEDDREYLIKAELPEIPKEEVNVTVENGTLILRGERRLEKG